MGFPKRLVLIVCGRTGINIHQFVVFAILWPRMPESSKSSSGPKVGFNNTRVDCCIGFGFHRFSSKFKQESATNFAFKTPLQIRKKLVKCVVSDPVVVVPGGQ